MRSITRLFKAFATLADSVLALSAVVDVAAGRLRMALALDEPPTTLEHQAAGGDNAALDGDGGSTEQGCSVGSNGKSKKSRAGV